MNRHYGLSPALCKSLTKVSHFSSDKQHGIDRNGLQSKPLYILTFVIMEQGTQPPVEGAKTTSLFIASPFSEESRSHFEKTVLVGTSYEDIAQYLNDSETSLLPETPLVHMWGISGGKTWEKTKVGDWMLFKKKGNIEYAAEVIATKHSQPLAEHLW